jgi:hypothetical protein
MPNIIELSRAKVQTKTASKVRVRNIECSYDNLNVAIVDAETGEFIEAVNLSEELKNMFMDMAEKELMSMPDYGGEQKEEVKPAVTDLPPNLGDIKG